MAPMSRRPKRPNAQRIEPPLLDSRARRPTATSVRDQADHMNAAARAFWGDAA